MGIEYSFLLYFERTRLWEALQGIAGIAQPGKLPTLIAFPDHLLSLPFEGFIPERIIPSESEALSFTTVLHFPPDPQIFIYLMQTHGAGSLPKTTPLPDGTRGVPVGPVYLHVHSDLRSLKQAVYQPELSLVRVEAASTTMSVLFVDSIRIRERLCQFLAQFHGVCGVLNMEDYGRLIWFNGREMDEDLPEPWLAPAEIAARLRQRSPGTG